ncbi:MAG: HDIG domain-containing protein [Bacteroidales bacterium]|nr:HDIG domain-containing protein [Bacteroidales bacterium]
MKRKNFKENLSQNLIKVVFFVLSAALILQSFPREGRFRYAFQEGKPWRYGLMTAPYDFQIFKTDKEIQHETDSIMSGFQPYISLDTTVFETVRNQLRSDFHSYLRITVPSHYLTYISRQLQTIYSVGILSTVNLEKYQSDSISSVMVVQNRVAKSWDLSTLFTTQEAYEALFKNLPPDIHTSILKTCKLNKYIVDNLKPDVLATNRARENYEKKVSHTSGLVQRGERIIDRGEIISADTYKVLYSMKKVAEERSAASGNNGVLLGQVVLVVGLFVLQFLFLWFFRPVTYERKANVVFILIMITGLVLLTSLVVHAGNLHVYMIPYAILPIMVRTFFDSRTALFVHIITVLISSTIVAYPYEFLLIQIAAGMTSVYSLKDLTQRSQLAFCAILVVITYCVMYLGISLIQEGFMNRINWRIFVYFVINGGFMLTSYLLIYLFEWMFGYTSNVTLVELSNINNPLLREFSETCPGSFQHSMQVSNLATAAAQEINANVQLVRTGSLYHDIGKMCNPIYFTENQSGTNPHDHLTPEESSKMIISHVSEGLKLAHKHGLPLVIRDCIRSHHGNGPVRYFYNAFKNEHPDEPVPEAYFYKGVNPASKETAILMMADALEASSRSLKEYSEPEISALVERIINMQFQEGSFKNVPITFRDLEKIKSIFKSKLQTIYHTRIAYPDMPAVIPSIVRE